MSASKPVISFINDFIDNQRDALSAISDEIWDHPETRFEESHSSALLADKLQASGFQVQRGVGGMETAFIASTGAGKPVIALLGEFDALAGLSQQAGCDYAEPLEENGNGHGCGHNLLGTAALGGALAVKAWLEREGIAGTVRFYGCPGEEGGSGKTFMAREGLFDDVDAALTWHPETFSGMFSNPTLANIQAAFHFKGAASHAAAAPHLGRSALDALTLMNTGANFLREHIIQEARVHYAVTNAGGISPNVVQADAEVLYLVRAPQLDQAQAIFERVIDIAKGAALMTGTKMTLRFDKACSNYAPNRELESLMYQYVQAFGTPDYTAEERAFAQSIYATLNDQDIDNSLNSMAKTGGTAGREFAETLRKSPLTDSVAPYCANDNILYGSTDVGDVSWLVPTAQCFSPCFVVGSPLHTWQIVSQGRTSLAHKGMCLAAKVMGSTAIALLSEPALLEACQQEHRAARNRRPYHCPIPEGIKPSPLK
ncbi:M20 family metallopeptidase [Serratia sp. M24T3]|uniref:M20 family metallopeptidase n=1 Tax=Serratia sp. M24T3 TaxID=932213 RepID=UPI00025BA31F|nr:M20 family metallopeptidase [Serratia sp. M24T3]EIC83778.1 amidohydrolase [Serratia sp. M24T3]